MSRRMGGGEVHINVTPGYPTKIGPSIKKKNSIWENQNALDQWFIEGCF